MRELILKLEVSVDGFIGASDGDVQGWIARSYRDEELTAQEAIGRLTREAGGPILAHGGASFAHALSRLGLVDVYRLVVHPVGLGSGPPLLDRRIGLDIVDSRAFPGGAVVQIYRPEEEP